MNATLKKITTVACALACAFSACACGTGTRQGSPNTDPNTGNITQPDITDNVTGTDAPNGGNNNNQQNTVAGKSQLLASPPAAERLDWQQNNDEDFCAFKGKVGEFSAKFAAAANPNKGNFAVSPVSVYMALALAAECANGDTRAELLNALGVDYDTLLEYIPMLYSSLNVEYTEWSYENGQDVQKDTGKIRLTNSIWVNDGTEVKSSCLDELANQFYCYSHSADFANDNAAANQAIRDFVKEKTNGLIDQNFELSPQTLFTLINTLYIKEVWTKMGDDKLMTNDIYDFAGQNETKRTKLLESGYYSGRTYRTEDFSAYYTTTYHGMHLYFFTPNDGKTIDRVFTAQNIDAVRTHDYQENSIDRENRIMYLTRCLFPEYKAEFDEDVKPVLHDAFDINSFFNPLSSNMTNLTDEQVYCTKVKHVTKLDVNKKGIEGAAVTVIEECGTAAPGGDEEVWSYVYETFTVDKSFGFMITDRYDTTLFSGIIYDL